MEVESKIYVAGNRGAAGWYLGQVSGLWPYGTSLCLHAVRGLRVSGPGLLLSAEPA